MYTDPSSLYRKQRNQIKEGKSVGKAMENSTQETNSLLINSFMEITSSTKDEALFFLESHQWDLDAAVSTFLDDATVTTPQPPTLPPAVSSRSPSPSQQSPSTSPSASLSRSPSRSRSPSPASAREPYQLRSRRRPERKEEKKASGSRGGGIRTLADLNRTPSGGSGSDDDEPQQYYTGGEKSGMLVQDPTRGNDVNDVNVDSIFNQARRSAVEGPPDHPQPSSSSKAFTGTARRLLTGETVPSALSQPEEVVHNITFWRNGFTVDDGPLRRIDDPANASFLESIMRSECPRELEVPGRRTGVQVQLNRRGEDYPEPRKGRSSFQGVGRTLGSGDPAPAASEPSVAATSLNTAPLPSQGLVVDASTPTTSIQLRLADGTRMVSRFNYHHTIGDIHAFIDASRPGGTRNYLLQAMGFPPKPLSDLSQTIEQAGIANSVVIQKL